MSAGIELFVVKWVLEDGSTSELLFPTIGLEIFGFSRFQAERELLTDKHSSKKQNECVSFLPFSFPGLFLIPSVHSTVYAFLIEIGLKFRTCVFNFFNYVVTM